MKAQVARLVVERHRADVERITIEPFDLRGKPRYSVGPDGRMALSDHLREFRARLIRSALVLVVAFVVAALVAEWMCILPPRDPDGDPA